jgi:hypothetical protein
MSTPTSTTPNAAKIKISCLILLEITFPIVAFFGKWKVESGKWKVESGKWKVESGKWGSLSGDSERGNNLHALTYLYRNSAELRYRRAWS